MNFMECFLDTLENNGMEYRIDGDRLVSDFKSFHNHYHLSAQAEHGGVALALDSGFTPDAESLRFLAGYGETQYPLFRHCPRDAAWQKVLDRMQSSADDLLGFAQDIAEQRHTVESAKAAFECAKSYRDTPEEIAMLDSPLVERMRDHASCAWYPSAGDDCRDLFYLCGEYPGIATMPDLFIHTDALPPEFINGGEVYRDKHTVITAKFVREYDRLPKQQKEFAHWQKNPGYAAEYRMKIESDCFGAFERSLLYIVCENEFFVANLLIPNRIALDTICRVRYGNSFGGANNSGAWILSSLNILRVKHFLSDPHRESQSSDFSVLEKYPQLNGYPARIVPGTVIPGELWSDNGDVSCFEVK